MHHIWGNPRITPNETTMMTPRRRGTALAGASALLLLFAACAEDEALDPQMRAPTTGIYTY